MTTVRIAGVGLTPFGGHGDRVGRDLLAETPAVAAAAATCLPRNRRNCAHTRAVA